MPIDTDAVAALAKEFEADTGELADMLEKAAERYAWLNQFTLDQVNSKGQELFDLLWPAWECWRELTPDMKRALFSWDLTERRDPDELVSQSGDALWQLVDAARFFKLGSGPINRIPIWLDM